MSIEKMTKGEWWHLNMFAITVLIASILMLTYETITKKEMNILFYLVVFCIVETLVELFIKNVLKESTTVTSQKRYFLNMFKFFILSFIITVCFMCFGLYVLSYVQLWIIFGLIIFAFEFKVDKKNEYI